MWWVMQWQRIGCQCRRHKRCGFNPWVGKIPWKRASNSLQYSCLENPMNKRSLVGYSPWGHKESDMTQHPSMYADRPRDRNKWTSWVALVEKTPPASTGDVRRGFDLWVRKILWRRVWQPTPVFLPRESHGQRSLVGYSLWGQKSVRRGKDWTQDMLFRKQRAGKIPQLSNQCVTSSFIPNTISRKEVNAINVLLFNSSRSASPYWANATTQSYTVSCALLAFLTPRLG